MSRPLNQSEAEALEAMLDRTSLVEVLKGLLEICDLKAQHIRENW